MNISQDLIKQIEDAFNYRGHVTVTFKDKTAVEGFLYNRQFSDSQQEQGNYVDLIVKNKDERRRIPIADILSIALTGEDPAAGKSYADYLAKQKTQK
jgi:hypothetical protein